MSGPRVLPGGQSFPTPCPHLWKQILVAFSPVNPVGVPSVPCLDLTHRDTDILWVPLDSPDIGGRPRVLSLLVTTLLAPPGPAQCLFTGTLRGGFGGNK